MKMNTYTGHQFEPMEMCEEDIILEDIAHALSMMCRGCGQIQYFFTVAQHSINCAHEAKARGYSKRVELACLLHDASEAYLSDIIRPMKMHLPEYYSLEDKIMDVIYSKFGLGDLTKEEASLWRKVDNEMLTNELKCMMVGEKDSVAVLLASSPDFRERDRKEVEQEFLAYVQELLDEQ